MGNKWCREGNRTACRCGHQQLRGSTRVMLPIKTYLSWDCPLRNLTGQCNWNRGSWAYPSWAYQKDLGSKICSATVWLWLKEKTHWKVTTVACGGKMNWFRFWKVPLSDLGKRGREIRQSAPLSEKRRPYHDRPWQQQAAGALAGWLQEGGVSCLQHSGVLSAHRM